MKTNAKEQAIDAYIRKVAHIDAMLRRLQSRIQTLRLRVQLLLIRACGLQCLVLSEAKLSGLFQQM